MILFPYGKSGPSLVNQQGTAKIEQALVNISSTYPYSGSGQQAHVTYWDYLWML